MNYLNVVRSNMLNWMWHLMLDERLFYLQINSMAHFMPSILALALKPMPQCDAQNRNEMNIQQFTFALLKKTL